MDGLAVGVSAISSVSMMAVSLIIPLANSAACVPLMLCYLTGACLGFLPYNFNPAEIFMGDVGSQFLGFVLAVISIMGLFKFHAIITLLIPFVALFVPLADTLVAVIRRSLHGQSPFQADRGHIHHKLLEMGMSQKQAVAVLYAVSTLLGFLAVFLAKPGTITRLLFLLAAFAISVTVWVFVFHRHPKQYISFPGKAKEDGGDAGSAGGGSPSVEVSSDEDQGS